MNTIKNFEQSINEAIEQYRDYNEYPEVGIREYTENNWGESYDVMQQLFQSDEPICASSLNNRQQKSWERFLNALEERYEDEYKTILVQFENKDVQKWINIFEHEDVDDLLYELSRKHLDGAKMIACSVQFRKQSLKPVEKTDIAENLQRFLDNEEWNEFLYLIQYNEEDAFAILALIAEFNPYTVDELESLYKTYEFLEEADTLRDFIESNNDYDICNISENEVSPDDYNDEYMYEEALVKRAIDIAVDQMFYSDTHQSPYFYLEMYIDDKESTFLIFNSNN